MCCTGFVRLLGSLTIAAAGVLSGCAGAEPGDTAEGGPGQDDREEDGGGDSPAPVSLKDELAHETPFAVADHAGGSRASVMAVALSDGETAAVELSVVGGVLSLSLDEEDQVSFHDLYVDTADVLVSPTIVPPDGLVLTDLTVELAEPVSVQLGSSTDDALAAGAELSVDVKWAVAVEHGTVELVPIRLPALAFDVAVEADDSGQLTAHLTASHPGVFWSWAGIFELRDLEIDLVAAVDL